MAAAPTIPWETPTQTGQPPQKSASNRPTTRPYIDLTPTALLSPNFHSRTQPRPPLSVRLDRARILTTAEVRPTSPQQCKLARFLLQGKAGKTVRTNKRPRPPGSIEYPTPRRILASWSRHLVSRLRLCFLRLPQPFETPGNMYRLAPSRALGNESRSSITNERGSRITTWRHGLVCCWPGAPRFLRFVSPRLFHPLPFCCREC